MTTDQCNAHWCLDHPEDAAAEIKRLRGWLEAIKYRSHGHGLAMLMANDALRGCVVPVPDVPDATTTKEK